jgi:hypothetical protein
VVYASQVARTKGHTFGHVQRFSKERFGERAWPDLLSELSSSDQQALAEVVAVGWYDLDLYARLIRALDNRYGRGDLALLDDLGRYEAEQDYRGIFRLFFRMASPAYMVEKTADYWRRFHDAGDWAIERRGSTAVWGALSGWGVDDALCRELVAYVKRAIELVGGKDVSLEHPRCRARGSSRCEYLMNWR